MAKKRPKCVGGRSVYDEAVETASTETTVEEKKEKSMIKIGKQAPDFELSAYHEGEFKTIKLSDYKGRWVLLCFYPGDFTFV